ncbi:hypothetical protein ACGFWI_03790 [Streptomyces sp. NPDC048434]|uniref:hypothetical protein n=1 Tax=Streptomyces sp. NPDC048434 TaxID=3365549 RepID=UPI0037248F2D
MVLDGDDLVGWINIRRDTFAHITHWGTLQHVQTRTDRRGQGIGIALMKEATLSLVTGWVLSSYTWLHVPGLAGDLVRTARVEGNRALAGSSSTRTR